MLTTFGALAPVFLLIALGRVGVVVDVRLPAVFAGDVFVRQVRVLERGVVVLVPVRRDQVLYALACALVMGDMRVLVVMDDRRVRVGLEAFACHANLLCPMGRA